MLITKLIELEKSKVKVYIDEEYAFPLYQKDIVNYEIEEGKEITEDACNKLLCDVVLNRAKQKAIAILKFMDRTEFELKKKLAEADYPQGIIDRTISYLYEYQYINDERFTSSYIRLKKEYKSRLVIRNDLLSKGIDKQLLDKVIAEEYSSEEHDPEDIAIQKAIAKKTSDTSSLSWEEKQKLIASLYRKGYSFEKIKHFI